MYWLLAIWLILKCVLLCWLKTTQYKSSRISSANLLRALAIFDLLPASSPELKKCPGSNPVDQVIGKNAVTKVKVSDFSAEQTEHWPTYEEGDKSSFY